MTWYNYVADTSYITFEWMFDSALEIRKILYLTNEGGQTPKTYDLSLPSCLLTVQTPYDLVILADYEFGSVAASAIPVIYDKGTCFSSFVAYEDIDGSTPYTASSTVANFVEYDQANGEVSCLPDTITNQ